jgi:uncharacterized protein YecE (DUF72 family)
VIHFGIAGWDYPDWEGIVYPSPHPQGFDPLGFIADYLDAVEINVTFYRQPDASAVRGWARRVAGHPGFRFTAKLFRDLTHGPPHHGPAADAPAPDPATLGSEAARYRAGITPLAEAGCLGTILAQFPHRFHDRDEARRHLETLAGLLQGLPLVAEFRHRSWDHEDALRFLHGLGIGFCNIDQPQVGGTMRPTGHVTSGVAYVRLHGRNADAWFGEGGAPHARYDYLYDPEELRPWAERAGRLAERAEEVFVIANNHYRGKGPANALMLKAMASGQRVKAPASLVREYKELAKMAIAEERGRPVQGRLF